VVGRPEWRTLNAPNRLYRHATYSVALPGPAGALPTERYMILVEGYHEAQARVAIEKAVVANRLEFAGPLKSLLLGRAAFQKALLDTKDEAAKAPPADWLEQRQSLFDFAAQAANRMLE
jgi:hypothetical protein